MVDLNDIHPAAHVTDFMQNAAGFVEILCAAIMLAVPIGLLIWAWARKRPFLGTGLIYFLVISEIIPTIVILSLNQVLDKASAGTILASVAGYSLSGMAERRSRREDDIQGPA
jgi:uncharacterized membrane protein YhfC